MGFNVCIAGATGNVGRTMIKILEERNFPVDRLRLLASIRSVGKKIPFKGSDIEVEELTLKAFEKGEIVLDIQIPKPEKGSIQAYRKFRHRKSIDFPVAGVAINIAISEGKVSQARIVLGAVKPIPFRAIDAENYLVGKEISPETAEIAASIVVKGVLPLTENGYKVNIVKTLVKRALIEI